MTKTDQTIAKQPAATPSSPVRPAKPTVDSKELMNTMEQLVAAYNKGSYVVASRYVDDEVVARCGGAQNYAVASRRHSVAEQLAYTVERVEVTGGVEARVEADVYYSSKDVRTGRAIDVHQGNGLTFVRSNRPDIRWVLADAFPLGVAGTAAELRFTRGTGPEARGAADRGRLGGCRRFTRRARIASSSTQRTATSLHISTWSAKRIGRNSG